MAEPTWLDRVLLEVIHTDQIAEHGGSLGIRDEGLLESALALPKNKLAYEPASDPATLAAAYGFGIAKNHPFVDGNKRTTLMAIYTFLAINGLELDAPEAETVTAILGTADSNSQEDDLASWIRGRLIPWVE